MGFGPAGRGARRPARGAFTAKRGFAEGEHPVYGFASREAAVSVRESCTVAQSVSRTTTALASLQANRITQLVTAMSRTRHSPISTGIQVAPPSNE